MTAIFVVQIKLSPVMTGASVMTQFSHTNLGNGAGEATVRAMKHLLAKCAANCDAKWGTFQKGVVKF